MSEVFTNDWKDILQDQLAQEYYVKMRELLIQEYKTKQIFPKASDIFNAFHLTPYNEVKVVIIGQDPYHDDNQAHGLCFSVKKEVPIPPSLRNIYKELEKDCGCYIPKHGNLEKWAKQGVLLINAVLTVRAHEAASHSKIGWEQFTDYVISRLNERKEPVIFLLWGNFARSKKKLITNNQHYILESAHPSPLSASRGFFGSCPFSKINKILDENNQKCIDWQIDD
jgi:uracil-DNA glycosylase